MSTEAQQRVAIAKDALKWIKAGALIPETQMEVVPTNAISTENYNKPIRQVNLGRCRVCAMGALFLGQAVRDDSCTLGDLHYNNGRTLLKKYFSQNQLDLIESYFEGTIYSWHTTLNKYSDEDQDKVHHFLKQHLSDSERLTLILQNIIDNHGTFISDQLE